VLKLRGYVFIDPKSSEILSIFQVFPCTTQIALFWPKLLPALFLKQPWYPCPFEILEETLWVVVSFFQQTSCQTSFKDFKTEFQFRPLTKQCGH
jgi:hypothetical protein